MNLLGAGFSLAALLFWLGGRGGRLAPRRLVCVGARWPSRSGSAPGRRWSCCPSRCGGSSGSSTATSTRAGCAARCPLLGAASAWSPSCCRAARPRRALHRARRLPRRAPAHAGACGVALRGPAALAASRAPQSVVAAPAVPLAVRSRATLPGVARVARALAVAGLPAPRQRLASFAIAWFLLQLSLEALLPLFMFFEHRTYLPLFGPALVVPVLLMSALGRRARGPRAAGGAARALRRHLCQESDVARRDHAVDGRGFQEPQQRARTRRARHGAGRRGTRRSPPSCHFVASVRLDPRPPETWLHAGDALARLGAFDAGVALMQESGRRDPRAWAPPHALGAIWLERGRADLAIPFFERARELAPELPIVHHSLGVADERYGRLDQAGRTTARRCAWIRAIRARASTSACSRCAAARGRGDGAALAGAGAEPDSLVARNNLAWLLATAAADPARSGPRGGAGPDGARRQRRRGSGRARHARRRLRVGRPLRGRAAHGRAGGLARRGVGRHGPRRALRARAELYRAGRPYRESAATPH